MRALLSLQAVQMSYFIQEKEIVFQKSDKFIASTFYSSNVLF